MAQSPDRYSPARKVPEIMLTQKVITTANRIPSEGNSLVVHVGSAHRDGGNLFLRTPLGKRPESDQFMTRVGGGRFGGGGFSPDALRRARKRLRSGK